MTALGSNVFEYALLVEEDPSAENRVIEKMEIGRVVPYGPIHLIKIRGTRMNKKKDPALTPNEIAGYGVIGDGVQLFPALDIEGLKILDPSGNLVDFPEWASEVKLTLGPVIVAKGKVTLTSTHELTLPPGYYQSVLAVN